MIPLSTTTITVLRMAPGDEYDEPYSGVTAADRVPVVKGVRAVIDRPSGREQVVGGEQSIVDLILVADPCDVEYTDQVRDERTGSVYRVSWIIDYGDHIEGGLSIVRGEA